MASALAIASGLGIVSLCNIVPLCQLPGRVVNPKSARS
jgi:hypothetical protein